MERSTDGINFLKISEIPAKGVGKYSFVDHTPINGINYYRLTQYDLNGTKTDLGVKDINFDIENKSISVFPIPAKIGASIYIEANYPYTFYDFELLDVSGKILLKEPKYINKEKAELKLPDNIKPGVYILKIGKTESRKVLVGL
ncbi:T9SS type A sorting domain-containing protein [Pseudopedobacter sp.]|uniref:T9SS type A sorting domain-containing protein n=1 Tax=Pseudopedobacter sp. TaxID=1936787 RepID=UPI0033425FBD